MGANTNAAPKAIPPIILAIYNISYDEAKADNTAEIAYKKATKINIFFLPYRSLSLPENNIANIAAKDGALTTQPD